jgi:acyl-CoA thioester hydrolase
MSRPIVYKTQHRIRFSDLDAYDHVSTGNYATYFVDHRMAALAQNLGWDTERLRQLPFMMWVKRLELDFVRSARGHQDISITSFVQSFSGSDVLIECTMRDEKDKTLARCLMTATHIDRASSRPSAWPADIAALFFEPAQPVAAEPSSP